MTSLPACDSSDRKVSSQSLNSSVSHHGRTTDASFQAAIDFKRESSSSTNQRDTSNSAASNAAAVAVAAASGSSTDPVLQDHSSSDQITVVSPKESAHDQVQSSAKKSIDSRQNGGLAVVGLSSRKVYDCHVCGWRFALKGNLIAHLRRHTGEKPYICAICDRKFTQSSLLTVHMRTHTGEKPFKCSKCGRSFSRSGNLTTHMRTHSAHKPYECAFCRKSFSQRVNMELHTRVHTGVKPYRCGVCNRAFTSCSNMRRHWRHIHPSYPEPAVGTLHLLHGMPEKALYSEPGPRSGDFRAPDTHYPEEHQGGTQMPPAVTVPDGIPSAIPANHNDQISPHLLAGHGINTLSNAVSHHEMGNTAGSGGHNRPQPGSVMSEGQSIIPSMASHMNNSHMNQHLAAQLAAQMSNQMVAQMTPQNGYRHVTPNLAISGQLNRSSGNIPLGTHRIPMHPHLDGHAQMMSQPGSHTEYNSQNQSPADQYSVSPLHYSRVGQPLTRSNGPSIPLEPPEEYDPAMKESDGRISASATADS